MLVLFEGSDPRLVLVVLTEGLSDDMLVLMVGIVHVELLAS